MKNKILRFRAWDGLNKKFSYWTMNDLCTYAEKDEKPSALDNWQQDTGLLDCNGKEIYDGDILKNYYRSETTLVEWRAKEAQYSIGGYHNETIEVIGNIYEHPELVK